VAPRPYTSDQIDAAYQAGVAWEDIEAGERLGLSPSALVASVGTEARERWRWQRGRT
jgi:hypothetical protein